MRWAIIFADFRGKTFENICLVNSNLNDDTPLKLMEEKTKKGTSFRCVFEDSVECVDCGKDTKDKFLELYPKHASKNTEDEELKLQFRFGRIISNKFEGCRTVSDLKRVIKQKQFVSGRRRECDWIVFCLLLLISS